MDSFLFSISDALLEVVEKRIRPSFPTFAIDRQSLSRQRVASGRDRRTGPHDWSRELNTRRPTAGCPGPPGRDSWASCRPPYPTRNSRLHTVPHPEFPPLAGTDGWVQTTMPEMHHGRIRARSDVPVRREKPPCPSVGVKLIAHPEFPPPAGFTRDASYPDLGFVRNTLS